MLIVLSQGLLKLMKDANGNLSYRAVQKNELDACEESVFSPAVPFLIFSPRKKGLSGEETMVLGHIQAAATQG
jgi:DNA-directed RNA polymerase III subunit RPC6